MMRLRKLWLVAVMGGLALLCATGQAQAEPFLWLGSTGGGNSGVIPGAGGNPAVATFSGPLPGDPLLIINSSTGISTHNPDGSGSLDLISLNVAVGAHGGTDTLYILLSDVNFGPIGLGTLTLSIGGNLDPNTGLTAWGKKDPTNTLWGGVTPTVPPGTLSGNFTGQLGAFTNSSTSNVSFSGATSVLNPDGPYSLTEELKITFGPSSSGTQTVSFSFKLQDSLVPEPSSLTLAISGLTGFGIVVYGLRRRKLALT